MGFASNSDKPWQPLEIITRVNLGPNRANAGIDGLAHIDTKPQYDCTYYNDSFSFLFS